MLEYGRSPPYLLSALHERRVVRLFASAELDAMPDPALIQAALSQLRCELKDRAAWVPDRTAH